ncbi:MAG: L,D-transpeptidase family protein [Candidatus Riflebacteria bacterium]|nr:L,D-transpeptidase family protein [Candidatus Riflebacteria bacterium]
MRKLATILGDYLFYCFAAISVVTIVAIVLTPARDFLMQEVKRSMDFKGQKRSIEKFNKKLQNAGITRESFNPQILIRKRNREMLVLSNDTIVASYPIGIGRATIGIKLNAKDQKTPEGQYYVCKKDINNRFHLFLQINYPSPDDAKRGSVQRIIKATEEAEITKAWKNSTCPPTNTALGGPLGIHGFGAESSWTSDGSISLHNTHIEELFWNIATGTSVAIIP